MSDDLLPTPTSRDFKGRTHADVRKPTTRGNYLPDALHELPAAGALLPTPTTLDNVEKRTTHAGGNLTLQGALCGVNPADVSRHADAGRHMLPTPVAQDGNGHVQDPSADVGNNGRSVSLGDVVTRMPQDGNTLLPTPTTSDSRGARQGGAHDEHVRVPRLAAAVEVDLPAELAQEGNRLLPTPNAGLGLNNRAQGSPPSERAAAGHSVTLADVACHLDEGEGLFAGDPEQGFLLSTPQSRDWSRGSVLNFPPDSFFLKESGVGALMPTPTSSDGSGGGIRTNLSWENTTKSTGEGGTSRLRDVVGLLGGDDLLPTPRSRDAKGPTASRSGDNKHDLPSALAPAMLPTPAARDGLPAKTEETMRRQKDRGYGPNLNDVAANYLPTPKARDWTGHGPSSMERNTPDLNAISRILEDTVENDTDTELDDLEAELDEDFAAGDPEDDPEDDDEDDLPAAATEQRPIAWGKYEAAIRCWERVTRPAPAPTEMNKNGNPRLAAGFSEWLMGWPEGHVTDPEIGISRNDQLRITGNGVVPAQAAHAIRTLLKIAWDNP